MGINFRKRPSLHQIGAELAGAELAGAELSMIPTTYTIYIFDICLSQLCSAMVEFTVDKQGINNINK